MLHAAVFLRLDHALDRAHLLAALPTTAVQGMEQVKIDMIGLQALELLCQQAVEIVFSLIHPGRRLGGQIDLVAVATRQRLTHDLLGVAAYVVERGIDVVDAVVDGVVHHFDGFFDIHFFDARGVACLATFFQRKAHHAEAERAYLAACFADLSIFHVRDSFQYSLFVSSLLRHNEALRQEVHGIDRHAL